MIQPAIDTKPAAVRNADLRHRCLNARSRLGQLKGRTRFRATPRSVDKVNRYKTAAAAEAMRRILIDRARAKARQKRGGGELERMDINDVHDLTRAGDFAHGRVTG